MMTAFKPASVDIQRPIADTPLVAAWLLEGEMAGQRRWQLQFSKTSPRACHGWREPVMEWTRLSTFLKAVADAYGWAAPIHS